MPARFDFSVVSDECEWFMMIGIVMNASSSGVENAFRWSEGGWFICMA